MRIMAFIIFMFAVSASVAQQKQQQSGDAERGRYLTEQVAMCVQCHTPRDANGELIRSRLFGGAPIPVSKPAQWNTWAEFAPRIAGLPQYTEKQMVTLLMTGIGREGKPLRAPMPAFKLTKQDAEDVVAYLKSVE